MRENTGRKCSYCGNLGHNSRTCNIIQRDGGLRIFGVQFIDPSPSLRHPPLSSFSPTNNYNNAIGIERSFSVDSFLPSSQNSFLSTTSSSSSYDNNNSHRHITSDSYLAARTTQEKKNKGE